MATKKILTNYDFSLNELKNFVVDVVVADPAGVAGQMIYRSDLACFKFYDGTSWECVRFINDAGTSITDLWSATQIQNAIDTAVSSAVNYAGGYDAATNSPDITTGTPVIPKGNMYTVTVAGTFLGEEVSVGDVIITEIEINSAGALADYTIVERNQNTATETSEGVAEIATQAEVDTATDDVRYVTPLKLKTSLDNAGYPQKFSVDLANAETSVLRTFAGGITTYAITHTLLTSDLHAQTFEQSSSEEVETDVKIVDANTVHILVNGNNTDDTLRVVLIG